MVVSEFLPKGGISTMDLSIFVIAGDNGSANLFQGLPTRLSLF